MSIYIHETEVWPNFTWDLNLVSRRLGEVRLRQGILLGRMNAVGFGIQDSASVKMLTADVVKSSAIEGENLDLETVRSSVARKLGIDIGVSKPQDRHVEGIVNMLLDTAQHFHLPLTEDRLCKWHKSLFPTGRSALRKISVGGYRTDASGPMQVVSGGEGQETVHFQAPDANRLKNEMEKFLTWFETNNLDLVLKAGIAHIWFITIHPFDDGNGRIARAITDLCLARSEESQKRFYSLSSQIQLERKSYYEILEETQKQTSRLDITGWLIWFLDSLERAILNASKDLDSVFEATDVWSLANKVSINDRQKKILNRLLNAFAGKLTSTKYASLAKCSQDTASRDIKDLIEKKILKQDEAGGRSTSYSLVSKTIGSLYD